MEQNASNKPVVCGSCPHSKDRCVTTGIWIPNAQLTFLAEYPSWASVNAINLNTPTKRGQPFSGHGGMLIRKVAKVVEGRLSARSGKAFNMPFSLAYAMGASASPTKEPAELCRTIWQDAWLRNNIHSSRPVIIACGRWAAKSCGLQFRKIADIRGSTLQVKINGKSALVVPTFSLQHVFKSPGLLNVFIHDLMTAAELAYGGTVVKPKTITEISKNYVYPKTIQELSDLVDHILTYVDPEKSNDPNSWPIALDTETNTLYSYKKDAKVLILSVAWDSGKAASIMLDHPKTPYPLEEARPHIQRLLGCPKPKIFHNSKFDLRMLEIAAGYNVANVYWDSLLGEHFINEDAKGFYGLKSLAPIYVPEFTGYEDELHTKLRAQEALGNTEDEDDEGATDDNIASVKLKKSKPKIADGGFSNIDLETLLPYAAADADVTREICKIQFRKLVHTHQDVDAHRVMDGVYIPASRTLGRMEHAGVKIDFDLLTKYDNELGTLLDETQKKIWSLATQQFNINSRKQLGTVLQNLKFDTSKLTPSEDIATDKGVMQSYQAAYSKSADLPDFEGGVLTDGGRLHLAEALLLFGAAQKMKGSFLENIRKYSAIDGRLHTEFLLNGTTTGRLSSARLNLQNVPQYMCRILRPGTPEPIFEGYNVKALMIPDSPDELFFNLDIKQAELRACAYYTQDAGLIQALSPDAQGKVFDPHTYFMAKILNPLLTGDALLEKYKEIKAQLAAGNPELAKYRVSVKRVVFGILYGAGARKIAMQIGGTSEEEIARATNLIDAFFIAYPTIKKYIDDTRSEVDTYGYVKNVFGRYRRFGMAAISDQHNHAAKREATNFKIQSTSSDLVISQLCEISSHISEIGGRVALTVHDSMAGTIPKNNVGQLKEFMDKWLVARIQERFSWLPVPFLYDLEVGPNYGTHVSAEEWLRESCKN